MDMDPDRCPWKTVWHPECRRLLRRLLASSTDGDRGFLAQSHRDVVLVDDDPASLIERVERTNLRSTSDG